MSKVIALTAIIASMQSLLEKNPQDPTGLALKEMSEAYEGSISEFRLEAAKAADEKDAQIEDLKAQLAKLVSPEKEEEVVVEKPKVINDPVEYKGKKYQVLVAQINIPNIGVRTATEIVNDPKKQAIAELVKIESGAIKEVK